MNIADIFRQIAFEQHQVVNDQRRKYSGMPYVVHTKEVADIYAEYFPNDLVGQAACHGHDLLEDTQITVEGLINSVRELMDDFNHLIVANVVHLIMELTDEYTSERYPHLNRGTRKRFERERIARISDKAQTIKCCDMISNTASIVECDPDFARVYLEEKWALVKVLTGADIRLLTRMSSQALESQAKLAGMPIEVLQ